MEKLTDRSLPVLKIKTAHLSRRNGMVVLDVAQWMTFEEDGRISQFLYFGASVVMYILSVYKSCFITINTTVYNT